jgi:hypothetical protein
MALQDPSFDRASPGRGPLDDDNGCWQALGDFPNEQDQSSRITAKDLTYSRTDVMVGECNRYARLQVQQRIDY